LKKIKELSEKQTKKKKLCEQQRQAPETTTPTQPYSQRDRQGEKTMEWSRPSSEYAKSHPFHHIIVYSF
jgi:hypothetical protein